MTNPTTLHRYPVECWPIELKQKRGLLNGSRVQLARESRDMAHHQLARRLGIPTQELSERECGWFFWDMEEQEKLMRATDYPLSFFIQDDPPTFDAPTFVCGTDENRETHCYVKKGKR